MSFIFRPGGTNRPVLKQIPYYTAFNPRSIGTCALWLDAADPNGTGARPSVGTTITTWIDKSGTSNHCTSGTATFQTDSYGGYINFTGSQSYTITTVNGVVNQYFTIFVVEQLQNYAGGESAFMGGTTGSGNQNLHMRYVNGGGGMKFGFFANDLDASLVAFTNNATQPIRVWSFSFTASSRVIYLNGTSVASDSNNTYISGWAGAQIGKMYGGQFYTGRMREVMIFSGTVDTTQRHQIESYLIQKWAPTVSLPQGHLHRTKPAGIPVVSIVRTDGFKLIALILSAMSTVYTLSTYSLAVIANSVSAASGTVSYIWTVAVPTGAKGKNGILVIFFNLYSLTAFSVGQYFDYGIYIDGDSQLLGDATGTIRYSQTASGTFAMSSGGISLGTNGLGNGFPLIVPVTFSAGASVIQIGLKNSLSALSTVSSTGLGYLTNVLTSSGTSNTSNFIPQNTFTTVGASTYTVPTNTSAGVPVGVFIYCWGSGGCSAGGIYAGGSGGFVSGFYQCSPGTALYVVVGAIGTTSPTSGGGGTANQGNSSTLQAGGFSGVFINGAATQANCICLGGGGGGAQNVANGGGGGGGYPAGGNGTGGTGGSQSVQGSPFSSAGGNGAPAGGALIGASTYGVGAGGGGYWGGGCGNGGGGGGGSSFIDRLTSGATYANGGTVLTSSTPSANLPGGSANSFYQSGKGVGNGVQQTTGTGLVVIVPAVGTNPCQIGVSAKLYSV